MNGLSAQKAKEVHDNASYYHNRAEFNLYQFLLEIKKIRDERLYKDLGYSTFEAYCSEEWQLGRQAVYERIQIAEKLSEDDFVSYSVQFGHKKTLFLVNMSEEQREKVLENGVPTEQGEKPYDLATQNEIAEYQKRLKEKDALLSKKDKQLKEHEERIEELELIGPEVIEKKIEVEKVPKDYQVAKAENESLKKQLSSIQSDLRLLKIEHDLLEKNTAEAKRLEANIQTLRKQERSIDKKVKALFDFNDRIININRFFDTEMASLRFKPLINELQDTYATNQLISVVDMVQAWVEEMQAILPDKNRKIIEGEIIDE